MKYLLLISFAYANYIPLNTVGDCSQNQIWTNKFECQKATSKSCIKIPRKYNCSYAILEDGMIEDPNQPIWANRSKVSACAGIEDCQLQLAELVCPNERTAFINEEITEVYCNKIKGYVMVPTGKKIVAEDKDKKDAYKAAKDVEKAEAAAEKQELKDLKVRVRDSDSIDRDVKKAIIYLLRNI